MIFAWAFLQRQYAGLRSSLSLDLLLALYKACVTPPGSYGCEIWGCLKVSAGLRKDREAIAQQHVLTTKKPQRNGPCKLHRVREDEACIHIISSKRNFAFILVKQTWHASISHLVQCVQFRQCTHGVAIICFHSVLSSNVLLSICACTRVWTVAFKHHNKVEQTCIVQLKLQCPHGVPSLNLNIIFCSNGWPPTLMKHGLRQAVTSSVCLCSIFLRWVVVPLIIRIVTRQPIKIAP